MSLFLTGIASSFVASLAASFAGGGSSLILLPFLLMMAPGSYASLLTTTKVSAATMTLVSAFIHKKKNSVDARLVSLLISTGLIGTAIGTYLVQFHLNQSLFETLLAITLLVAGLYLLFSKTGDKKKSEDFQMEIFHWIVTGVFCFGINILNGLFGGTGIFMTLFCVLFLRMSFIRAIAYTMSMYVVINTLQTAYLLLTESVELWLSIGVVIGALAGSWIGTHQQYLKGNLWVKRASIVMMLIISGKILLGL